MHAAMQCLLGITCIHTSHESIAGGFDADGNPMGADTGIHPSGLSELLVRASLTPNEPCLRTPLASSEVLAAPDDIASTTHTGFTGDRQGVAFDSITRGKHGKQ